MTSLVLMLSLLALLGAGLLIFLWRSGYGFGTALSIAALTLGQSGLVCGGAALWFSLGICAVATAAVAFAVREDARTVMALGGSLAAIQMVNPVGGAVAAMVLPLAVSRRAEGRTPGLLILLMFAPAITAVGLAGAYWQFHFNPAASLSSVGLPVSASITQFSSHRFSAVFSLLPVLPALVPMVNRKNWTAGLQAVVSVLIAIVFAKIVLLIGGIGNLSAGLAVAAPLCAIAIAIWPEHLRKPVPAIAASLASLALSWLVLVFA